MYTALLIIHNFTRWLVLAAAVWALVAAYRGWLGRRAWAQADRTPGRVFAGVVSLQLVIGLLLYFWPGSLVQGSLANIGAAMGTRETRFFVVEHVVAMLLAVALAHMGGAFARRAPEDTAKHRRAAIWYSVATLVILAGIPWWRPLLRLG